MTDPTPLPRIAPPRVSPGAALAAKPPTGADGADAYRQLGFVLGGETDLVLELLSAESAWADASTGARLRNHRLAALLGHWSRAWLCRLQSLHAIQWGNYAAAAPLVAGAAALLAVQRVLLATAAAEWTRWLAGDALGLAPADHANEVRLHPVDPTSGFEADPRLATLHAAASAFARPDFGGTLLLAGHGSDATRIAVTFGDRDFHLGLAELELGWLLELSLLQVAHAGPATDVLAPPPDRPSLDGVIAAGNRALARPDRCRMEPVEREGNARWLVHNWRARPGAAPKRLLL